MRITGILREAGVKHIVGATFGMYGFGFNDFLDHEYSLLVLLYYRQLQFLNLRTREEKKELGKITFKPLSDALNYSEDEVTFPKRHKKNKFCVALNLYEGESFMISL